MERVFIVTFAVVLAAAASVLGLFFLFVVWEMTQDRLRRAKQLADVGW